MTPIILNLLAEEHQAEEASAHDPVKYAIAGAVGTVTLIVIIGLFISYLAAGRQTKVNALKAHYEKMTSQQGGGKFRQLRMFTESIVSVRDKRVLVAPQLARVKDIVPVRIQLKTIALTASLLTIPAPPPKEGEKPAKPRTTERLTLQLDGEAMGVRSSTEVDAFLKLLRTDPVLTNKIQEVTLRSIGAAAVVEQPDSRITKTQFVIECLYKESK